MANTYFNPNSIQNFADPANNGKFLKKNNSDIIFANPASRMKFVNFTGSTWDFNNSDDNTFTYGSINTDTVISVLRPTSSDKREILHILRIDNNDSVPHTITFQSNSNSNCELLSPYQFKVYANSSIEFIATAFMDSDDGSSPVNPKTQVSIYAVYGYEPYNAVENSMGFITVNDIPQSNWLETNASSRAYIQNKPAIISGIVFNSTPAAVNNGIATISFAQEQSNWIQDDANAVDYIKNKPTHLSQFINNLAYPTIAVTTSPNNDNVTITVTNGDGTTNQYNIPLSGGEGTLTQRQANWNETDSSSVQYILNKPTLATVATSGSYNDLSNKPTIPAAQVQSDWDAVSGMGEILNKPTNVSAFNNDAGYITAHQSIDSIISSTSAQTPPTIIAQSLAGGDTITLHKVAWTGTYDDLLNKPTIPVVPVNVSAFTNDAGYITSVPVQVKSDWNEINPASAAYIENKPSLFSGSYNDLTDTPTIPAAQVNSDWNAVSGVAQILNKPTIPAEQVNSDWNVSDPASKAYILNKPDVPEDSVDYLRFEFTSNRQNRNFNLRRNGNPSAIQLEYKVVSLTTGNVITDWTEWAAWADGNRRITTSGPVVIYLRGDNYADSISIFNTSNYYHFYFDANEECYCYGNLMTIYKKDGRITSIPSTKTYRFYKLFLNSSSYPCNIKSAPYVKLQSAPSNCFTDIFYGNPLGWGIKELKFDVIKGSENYIYERHQLNTAINPANGEIYVEKPSADSYVITLLYGSQIVDFTTLMSKYSAGAHIRCKDTTTVQGVEIYADMCAYDTYTDSLAGAVNRFTFKYVKAENGTRECWIYTCYKGTNATNASWNRVETTLDEVPTVSSATWGKFLTNDSVNGLAWEDVLPDQSGQSGKFLTTDGSVLSWGTPSGGGGVSQIQSDWTQTDQNAVDFIKHKPTIPAAQVNSDWNATTGVEQILNKPTLATVAISGNYNDLSNKPTIPPDLYPYIDYNKVINNQESGTYPIIPDERPYHYIIQFDVTPDVNVDPVNPRPYTLMWNTDGGAVSALENAEYKLIIYNNTNTGDYISIKFYNPWNNEPYQIDVIRKKYVVLNMWFYTINNEAKVLFMEYNYTSNVGGYTTQITML